MRLHANILHTLTPFLYGKELLSLCIPFGSHSCSCFFLKKGSELITCKPLHFCCFLKKSHRAPRLHFTCLTSFMSRIRKFILLGQKCTALNCLHQLNSVSSNFQSDICSVEITCIACLNFIKFKAIDSNLRHHRFCHA